MADDPNQPIASGEIDNAHERVVEVVQMGKGLGFKFPEWYAILKMATVRMEEAFAEKGQTVRLIAEMACACPKCTKAREDAERRKGIHVVPPQ